MLTPFFHLGFIHFAVYSRALLDDLSYQLGVFGYGGIESRLDFRVGGC